jgi:hypothetical protein
MLLHAWDKIAGSLARVACGHHFIERWVCWLPGRFIDDINLLHIQVNVV